tara:strand:+ start:201 stop:365 length:165 start_codon:yes stop_codon:yes gene_type:complete
MAESAAPSVVTRVDADIRIGQPFTTSRTTIWQKKLAEDISSSLEERLCLNTYDA